MKVIKYVNYLEKNTLNETIKGKHGNRKKETKAVYIEVSVRI